MSDGWGAHIYNTAGNLRPRYSPELAGGQAKPVLSEVLDDSSFPDIHNHVDQVVEPVGSKNCQIHDTERVP